MDSAPDRPRKLIRMGTAIAFTGLILSFLLSVILTDPTPFTVTAPVCVGGKWVENWQERKNLQRQNPEAS